MLFQYPLSEQQYARFQHSTNDAEIRALCQRVGVQVTGEQVIDGVETWLFTGRCSGRMSLVPCDWKHQPVEHTETIEFDHWECWIKVEKKPWWLPWSLLDRGFQQALK